MESSELIRTEIMLKKSASKIFFPFLSYNIFLNLCKTLDEVSSIGSSSPESFRQLVVGFSSNLHFKTS